MSCDHCTDPDGVPCFPLYGIGPHTHDADGTTLVAAAEVAGYTPNPDEPGHGVHWCPYCGDGKPEPACNARQSCAGSYTNDSGKDQR